jgi:DEAD/DEAH box helicase domain-containing protein
VTPVHKLPDWLHRDQVTHTEVFPARPGTTSAWPSWAPPALVSAFGLPAPWQHQSAAAELAHSGKDVVIATGTGSGKTVAYLLPALTSIIEDSRARVLYLAPTKALAADQFRTIKSLNLSLVRAAVCTGDTSREERDWVRAHANFVLTNPDLLHHTMLPGHSRWGSLLRNLSYVIVDETHTYRGVFGAHVAHVLRRLRRLTADRPVFILASATSGDPAASATKLVGRKVVAVDEDTSVRGSATFILWEPPFLPGSTPSPSPPSDVPPSPGLSASHLPAFGPRLNAPSSSDAGFRPGEAVAGDPGRPHPAEAGSGRAGTGGGGSGAGVWGWGADSAVGVAGDGGFAG